MYGFQPFGGQGMQAPLNALQMQQQNNGLFSNDAMKVLGNPMFGIGMGLLNGARGGGGFSNQMMQALMQQAMMRRMGMFGNYGG